MYPWRSDSFKSVGRSAAKNQALWRRGFRRESIAVQVKAFQLARCGHAVRDGVARHQAACALGMKADDLVHAPLVILEHAVDHARLQGLAVHGLEVLLRGKV